MLLKQLQTDNGFFLSERVDGALFKADIRSIPDRAFLTSGINKLISSLDVVFSNISYAKPRMDTPCMYGFCKILGHSIAVESQLAWRDLRRIKQEDGGVFHIDINVDGAYSDFQRLIVSWDVENVPIDSIKMSPVIDLILRTQT
tara:strand:+ start:2040 stop:2471 length:432 start_codon:yes stop_codon:yes gene_type:complete